MNSHTKADQLSLIAFLIASVITSCTPAAGPGSAPVNTQPSVQAQPQEGTVSGGAWVSDLDGNTEIMRGLKISFYDGPGFNFKEVAVAQTDIDGKFSVKLPPGQYYAIVSKVLSGTRVANWKLPIQVAAGQQTVLNLQTDNTDPNVNAVEKAERGLP